MSRGPENTFIASVHRHLPPDLYVMKTHNEYISGPADSWYSGTVRDLWVEWKYIEVPKRPTTVIDLINGSAKVDSAISSLQKEWLKGRHAEGRNVAVGIGCTAGGVLLFGTAWDRTFTSVEFKDLVVHRKVLAERITQFVSGVAV